MLIRLAAVVSVSGGLGFLLGVETSNTDVKSRLWNLISCGPHNSSVESEIYDNAQKSSTPSWYQFLPVSASVFAASVPVDKSLQVAPSSAIEPPTYRVGEIMQYGYPGMDTVRFHGDFVVSYDRRNRVPHWVFEHIKKENCAYGEGVDRNKCGGFREDETIHPYFRSTNADYKQSGYDRGHLAAASNHRQSLKAMNETFVLSNIAPQVFWGFNFYQWRFGNSFG